VKGVPNVISFNAIFCSISFQISVVVSLLKTLTLSELLSDKYTFPLSNKISEGDNPVYVLQNLYCISNTTVIQETHSIFSQ